MVFLFRNELVNIYCCIMTGFDFFFAPSSFKAKLVHGHRWSLSSLKWHCTKDNTTSIIVLLRTVTLLLNWGSECNFVVTTRSLGRNATVSGRHRYGDARSFTSTYLVRYILDTLPLACRLCPVPILLEWVQKTRRKIYAEIITHN